MPDATAQVMSPFLPKKRSRRRNGSDLHISDENLGLILSSLQTMRDGDFSVRLPGSWTGIAERSPTHSMTSLPTTSKWRRNSSA